MKIFICITVFNDWGIYLEVRLLDSRIILCLTFNLLSNMPVWLCWASSCSILISEERLQGVGRGRWSLRSVFSRKFAPREVFDETQLSLLMIRLHQYYPLSQKLNGNWIHNKSSFVQVDSWITSGEGKAA